MSVNKRLFFFVQEAYPGRVGDSGGGDSGGALRAAHPPPPAAGSREGGEGS